MTILSFIIILFNKIAIQRIEREESRKHKLIFFIQKKMMRTNVETQEKQRKRFALEIHDNLISKLNIALLSIYHKLDGGNIEQHLTESIDIARGISHDLSPPLIEHVSFHELIEDHIESIKPFFKVDYHVSTLYDHHIKVELKLQVYRIFQEVITNIIKHAKATKIDIYLRISQKYLQLMITDNGIGFNANKIKQGLGLENIKQRTQLVKGKVKYKSLKNSGTRIIFETSF